MAFFRSHASSSSVPNFTQQLNQVRKEINENEEYLNNDIKKSLEDKNEALQKRILSSACYLAGLKEKEKRLRNEIYENPNRSQLEEKSIELEAKIQHLFSQAYIKITNARYISSKNRDEMKTYFNSKGQLSPYSYVQMTQLLHDVEDQKKEADNVCCKQICECFAHVMAIIVVGAFIGLLTGGRGHVNGAGLGRTDFEATLKEISAIYSDISEAVQCHNQRESINLELRNPHIGGSIKSGVSFTFT